MKKYLYLIALIICLILSACGTSAKFTSGLKTDSITIYDIATGETEVITDAELISDLLGSADTGNWKKQSKLSEQISATPNYAFDFGNGTCIGLLGDGYILVGTAFEYLSEDHQSYRFVDSCQYQVSIEFTDLLEEITVNAAAMEEVSAESEEMSVSTPEEVSVPTPEESVNTSLDSFMTEFMNGSLGGVQFGDGSKAAQDYQEWYDMLGGECVPAEASSPQEYWEIWCEHVENLYAGNGYEFFVEQDYPVAAKYIELKYGVAG